MYLHKLHTETIQELIADRPYQTENGYACDPSSTEKQIESQQHNLSPFHQSPFSLSD